MTFVVVLCGVVVAQAQQPFPPGGAPLVGLATVVEAEDYDLGGEGVAYHDTTAGNSFGVYRTDGVDIGVIPGGGYHLGGVAAGEWVVYTLAFPGQIREETGDGVNWSLRFRLASAFAGTSRFRILLDGLGVGGTQFVTSTGGWHSYVTREVAIGYVPRGIHRLRLEFERGSINLDSFSFRSCVPPVIAPQPESVTVDEGEPASFTSGASAVPAPELAWLKDGVEIPGATGPVLTLPEAGAGDVGQYRLRATNGCGPPVLSNPAALNLAVQVQSCGGDPGKVLGALADELGEMDPRCRWGGNYEPEFPTALDAGRSGSYNLPVLAAAAAYAGRTTHQGPGGPTTTVRDWWVQYLRGELGLNGGAPDWRYGGRELTSGLYQHYNILSVMAARHVADRLGHTDVEELAGRWLRATWALLALSAAPGYAKSDHDQVLPPDVIGRCNLNAHGEPFYDGPFLALAGMRSPFFEWCASNRGILFSNAIGWPLTRDRQEDMQAREVRLFLEREWGGGETNAYGLTAAEQAEMMEVVVTSELSSAFLAHLTGIKTKSTLHLIAWPGVRATLMETNDNGNTVPTYGVAWFQAPRLAGGQEAHFLYPWNRECPPGTGMECRAHKFGVIQGRGGSLDLAGRSMEATNIQGTVFHPLRTVRIEGLPPGPPLYHCRVGETGFSCVN